MSNIHWDGWNYLKCTAEHVKTSCSSLPADNEMLIITLMSIVNISGIAIIMEMNAIIIIIYRSCFHHETVLQKDDSPGDSSGAVALITGGNKTSTSSSVLFLLLRMMSQTVSAKLSKFLSPPKAVEQQT